MSKIRVRFSMEVDTAMLPSKEELDRMDMSLDEYLKAFYKEERLKRNIDMEYLSYSNVPEGAN